MGVTAIKLCNVADCWRYNQVSAEAVFTDRLLIITGNRGCCRLATAADGGNARRHIRSLLPLA